MTFEAEQRRVEHGTGVSDELGLGRVQDLNGAFQGRQEQRGLPANQVRHAVAGQQASPITRRVYPAYEPFLIADDDTGSRRHRGACFYARGRVCLWSRGDKGTLQGGPLLSTKCMRSI